MPQLQAPLQSSIEHAMRIIFHRILNLLLYLSFCVMVGTGLLMAYRLIPGSRGGQGLEVLGWNRHEWGALHTWVSYVFITLVAAHLAINWAWLTKCAAKGHAWRLGAGLLAGAVIIGTFLLLPITQPQGGTGKKHILPCLTSKRIHSYIVGIKRKCEFSEGHLSNL
jgi:hypothetical protein